jgi:predicted nucleic acid-binding protein
MESGTESDVRQSFHRAVLDANVLYKNALRDTLLRAAEKGLFDPLWSPLILEEVRRNLVAHGRTEEERIRRTIELMRHHFPRAGQFVSDELIARMTNAAEDRHVLAAAVAGQATAIVTSNLGDFSAASLEPYGIVALSPDDFLCRLLDANPDLLPQIIREQAADLVKPRRTAADVLISLAKEAPTFAVRVRRAVE